MRILACDQATRKTGIAVIESDNLKLIYSCVLQESDQDYVKRIYNMTNNLFKLFDEYKCEVISFENVTYQHNALALIELAQLQGMILSKCLDKSLLYLIPRATEWRSVCGFSGGRRAEQKEQAIDFVKNKYDIDVSDDESEAICQGWAMSNKYFHKE